MRAIFSALIKGVWSVHCRHNRSSRGRQEALSRRGAAARWPGFALGDVVVSVDEYIGKRILERRTELGLSRDQVADQIGSSSQEIAEFEAGLRRASPRTLVQLSRALDVNIVFFFENMPEHESTKTVINTTHSATVISFETRHRRSCDRD